MIQTTIAAVIQTMIAAVIKTTIAAEVFLMTGSTIAVTETAIATGRSRSPDGTIVAATGALTEC